ncbi:MAG: DNA gyrase modulator, partial [Bryobacteraceae bacterium]
MLTRRAFLESSTAAALATRLFAAPEGSTKPNPELENLGAAALHEARKLKASYADIRIIRYRQQFLTVRLNPERGTGKTLEVPVVSDGGSFGFGVRVIVDGAWGFAASPLVTREEIARMVGEAVAVARANAAIRSKPVELAPVPVYRERWQTPHERDPFAVPLEEKLDLIRTAAAEVKKEKGVFSSNCNLSFRSEDKYFASSVGSSIQQLNLQTYATVNATATDFKRRISKSRRYQPQQVTAGYEYVPLMNLVENAQRIRTEVI